jgi:hypothetical protein
LTASQEVPITAAQGSNEWNAKCAILLLVTWSSYGSAPPRVARPFVNEAVRKERALAALFVFRDGVERWSGT